MHQISVGFLLDVVQAPGIVGKCYGPIIVEDHMDHQQFEQHLGMTQAETLSGWAAPDGCHWYQLAIDARRADLLLELSKGNRAIRKDRVEQYGADMRQGNWTTGNDAILIDTAGRLLNGHHRLNAVAQSGFRGVDSQ